MKIITIKIIDPKIILSTVVALVGDQLGRGLKKLSGLTIMFYIKQVNTMVKFH